MTMVLIFLHTFWGILFFHGCEHRRWWEIMAVVVMHLAVSGSVSSWERSSGLRLVFGDGCGACCSPCQVGKQPLALVKRLGLGDLRLALDKQNPGGGVPCH